ncbi:MAG: translocation/assembly module TamB domain-containing protein, partial [Flavisolibacter sp.]|nr:translocation/assembly module TamB domain-containing protein [Flavisolibacter sp.]
MQTETRTISTTRKVARIALKVVLYLILFVFVIFFLLLTPPVQRFLTVKVENYLENKLDTKVEIGRIALMLPGKITLRDVYMEDQAKDTLVSGGTLEVNLSFLKLISGEVDVRDVHLQDVTAKITRVLPDTVFNFQFIIDAFAVEKTKDKESTPLKMNVDHVSANNLRILYNDVITGNAMNGYIEELDAIIDTLDPNNMRYDIPSLKVYGTTINFNQVTPLVKPKPIQTKLAEAAAPIPLKLNFGNITLRNTKFNYANKISEFFTNLSFGHLTADAKRVDLENYLIDLNNLQLDNSRIAIRVGKEEEAKKLAAEIGKEAEAQSQNDWTFRVDRFQVNNNIFMFENENNPPKNYGNNGIDYAHLRADSLTLHVNNFVFNKDSIGGQIAEGRFKEKNGFRLSALQGDVLYAYNQTYLKNLLIKTPGSEIKRNARMEYASFDALTNEFAKTLMDVEILNSYVQVKDILAFAPNLRSHPAMANPNDVWNLHLIGNGTMERLHFDALQFDGLRNTQIDAEGTLTGLNNPANAGGAFTIRTLKTNQTDLSLFTGSRLSTPEIQFPESFDITGTIAGNAGLLNTNLRVFTSMGSVHVDGRFGNLTNPDRATYNAQVRTYSLQLGDILRNTVDVGAVTANLRLNGTGFTPEAMNTKFNGTVQSIGYNNYVYRNISLDGSLRNSAFNVTTDINDPNADLNVTASGTFAANTSFKVKGFIDSIKLKPLNFSTDEMVFRGRIDADVASLNPDYLEGEVLVSEALFVSGEERMPIDSLHLVSGRTDTSQFIRLTSDIANAYMEGQYRFSELGSIFQNNIEPYFSVASGRTNHNIQPYDIDFSIDVSNSPFISSFLPDINILEPLHAEGSIASGEGITAVVNTGAINYQQNELRGVNLTVSTTENGLEFKGNIDHLTSGTMNIYNTDITATALDNVIDFNLSVDDKASTEKYALAGVFTQPSQGVYSLQLKPGKIILNYDTWNIPADNEIRITPKNITAQNFILEKDNQRLAIQSTAGEGSPLNVEFTNFELATITAFMQSDTLGANGIMNGNVTFQNLMQQPLFTSNLMISDFSVKNDTLGNVAVNVNNTADNRYIANVTLTGRGNDLQITGSVVPRGEDVALDLDLAVRKLELATTTGILSGFLTKASGSINGNVKVTGTLAEPDLKGRMNFNDASFTTVMFGAEYRIDNEQLMMIENGFAFNRFTIRDSLNNTLDLNGTILTPNFINYNFDLTVRSNKFKVLGTTKTQDAIYYGDLVVSTDLNLSGTEKQPVVDGSIIINEGTNFSFVMPQQAPGLADREGVVEFVNMSNPELDTLFMSYDSLNYSSLLGMDVALNVEVEKEAKFNMIIDEANGDFLNVQGEASLTAGIDPSGKITMTGSYEIEQGSYELSFNFLRRRFDIEKGSQIIWLGEPTRANLNVTAIYVANTAPLDLVQDQLQASQIALRNSYFLQKLPFEVHLTLTGELMTPKIEFDIILPERNYVVDQSVIQ